jgi:hypothetical protein
VKRATKGLALIALLATGLLAGAFVANGRAALTTPETVTETTTGEPVTVTETATTTETAVTTVQQTTTRRVVVHPATTAETTSSSESSGGTETWVWVLLGILAAGLIVMAVLLARRGGGSMSTGERRRRLDGAVGSWTAQGWALESQTADSAVLRRGEELMLVSIDGAGHVSTRPLQNP